MASKTKVPIFTDTNLGTRIAVSVPPDIAARDFKRKLEMLHSKCFPESGEIKIHGLMVKRKSCYYHLTDSVPMKHAFEGVRGTWFLHIEATTASQCFEPYVFNRINEPLGPSDSVTSSDMSDKKGKKGKVCCEKELQSHKPSLDERTRLVYASRNNERKEKEREKCFLGLKASRDEAKFLCSGSEKVAIPANIISYDHQQASRSVTEVPSEMFSEAKSVTSIIRRYFPNSNEKTGFLSPTSSEATSRCKKKVKSSPKDATQSPSNLLLVPLVTNCSEKILHDSVGKVEVGERIVVATNNLRLLSSKKKSAIHLCSLRKSRYGKTASLARLSVFDISSDSDD